MKKSDIEIRMKEIDARLSELPTICEKEQRELNDAEKALFAKSAEAVHNTNAALAGAL